VENLMRVAFVAPGSENIPPTGYGGIGRTIWELSEEMRRQGHDTFIFNLPPTGMSLRRYWLRLPKLLSRLDADVVHVHHQSPALRLGLLRQPFVFTPHLATWFETPITFWRRYSMTRDKLVFRLARVTTTMNTPFRDKLVIAGCGPVEYVPLGIDTNKWKAKTRGNPLVALGIGIIGARKRWDLAARGVQGTGVEFRIVGPIRDPVIAARLQDMGVKLLGMVTEQRLLEELDRCGFVIHPSVAEILPGAVLQAMSFSRPVIVSSNQSYLPWVISSTTDEPN